MAPAKPGKYEFNRQSISELRKRLGWSQAKLAQAIGVPPNTLSRWEAGSTTPDASSLASIFSVGASSGTPPSFFSKVPATPKAQPGRHAVLTFWDFQNLGVAPEYVKPVNDWVKDQLTTKFPAASHRVFKAFAHVDQTTATDELVQHGWRVWEDDDYLYEDLEQQATSDCGQDPEGTVFVLVSEDDDFADLISDLRQRGVDAYVVGRDGEGAELQAAAGADHVIRWP